VAVAFAIAVSIMIFTACQGCPASVLAANLVFAALFATPGAAVIAWRRFLR